MPVVNVNLLVDEKTYAAVQAGVLELCGMAKNIDNKRVAKHIPAVADAAKEGAVKAIDFIRVHKKGTVIVSGILIIGSAVAGAIGYIATRDKRNLEKQFAQNLQTYLDALDELSNDNPSKAVNLKIMPSQFSDLIQTIFDYTICLAEANNISPTLISKPKILKKKSYSDLQYYLNMQKNIFEQAA